MYINFGRIWVSTSLLTFRMKYFQGKLLLENYILKLNNNKYQYLLFPLIYKHDLIVILREKKSKSEIFVIQ